LLFVGNRALLITAAVLTLLRVGLDKRPCRRR
jgi:hypothetical protein